MSTALIVEDDLRLRADLAFMLRDEAFEAYDHQDLPKKHLKLQY